MPLGVLDSFTAHLDSFGAAPCWHFFKTASSGRELQFRDLMCRSSETVSRSTQDTPSIELLTRRLNEFVGIELSLVPDVEYVFTAFRNKVFYIWIVIDRFESQVRERIYDREKAVIDEFTMFEFDFYILSRQGRKVGDLVSESIELVFDRYRQH